MRECGQPVFRARQIFAWVHKRKVFDFGKMSDMPSSLREKLKNKYSIQDLSIRNITRSRDGTQKYLFSLNDANLIEAVNIPAAGRVTGCVSTQAGCRFACKFCASGIQGFVRNLECSEIIEQILVLDRDASGGLTNLVFMGTGEPLDNYDNVIKAARIINSQYSINLGARKITISTSGVIAGIERLSNEGLQIELSVSLHAADDRTRSSLMPINKVYPLSDLIKACRKYTEKTNRQITFEYILIKGINSTLQDALNLVKVLKGLSTIKVNLIVSNIVEESGLEPAGLKDAAAFKGCLIKHGINVTLRKPRGQDIDAACGQLRLRYGEG